MNSNQSCVLDLKRPFRQLGWNGVLSTQMMGWFGDGAHINRLTAYKSNNPDTIARQLQTMRECALDLVWLTWQGTGTYGSGSTFVHSTAVEISRQLSVSAGEELQFGLCVDPFAVKSITNADPAKEQALREDALVSTFCDNSVRTIFDRSSYSYDLSNSIQHSPRVLSFLSGIAINWDKVIAGVLAKTGLLLKVLQRNTDYTWPAMVDSKGHHYTQAESVAILSAQNKSPTLQIAGVCLEFNDAGMPSPKGATPANWTGTRDYSQDVWGDATARVLTGNGGSWFHDQLLVTPPSVGEITLVTFNDEDEGTKLEHFLSAVCGRRHS